MLKTVSATTISGFITSKASNKVLRGSPKLDFGSASLGSYYVITNTQGDVIEIHNGLGAVTAKYNYDSWGKLISITDASGTPLSTSSFAYQISVRYRGYVYDSETGLYYLQSRYYNLETSRFINCDNPDYIGISGRFTSWNGFAFMIIVSLCFLSLRENRWGYN